MAGHCEPESLPLAVFVREHGHSLPLRIQVEEGFYGKDERSVISSGDVYNFHFIRNTKTMSIQDSCGTRYSIPFNSSITFGLVYNPFNEPFHAVRHYSFTTVGEIMTCKHPPPIFRATREFTTRDTKSSIAKEEIFILKKVCRSGKKKKQHIRVHSLKTGDEKMLYRECEGHFQTDPGSVRLYLPEIAEYFKDSLPLVARVFLNSDVTDDCISSLVSDVVTLTHVSVESSIIATACWNDDSKPNSLEEITDADNQKIPIAIPMDLSIEVSLIKSRSGNNEELYQMTRHLFEGFQSTKVKDMKEDDMSADDPRQTLQRTLNRSVRLGHEKQGVVIEKPAKVYKKKSKASNRDDSKVKPLEVKPPTLQETAERMHKERRLPSISYSTFTSVPRRTAGPTKTRAHGDMSMKTCDQSCTAEVQGTVQDTMCSIQRSYSPTPPAAGPYSETPTYSNMDSSHYDVPRKQCQAAVSDPLASQKDVHIELLKPVPCPVVPNSRGNVSPHRSANVCKDSDCMNKDSLLQESANLSISETDYDVPKSVKTDIPPPLNISPITETTSNMCTSNSQQSSSLSELIRNHPLLKAPKPSDKRRDSELSHTKSELPECKGQSSLSSQHSKQEISEPALPLRAADPATVSNPSGSRLAVPMTFTRKAHTNTSRQPESPLVHELESPAPVMKPKSPGRSANMSSVCEKQSITYSEILNASMTRAQTLIARNIQELKRLDCHEVQVLLENMNLGQYKQHFFSEGIDGEILAECDEHVLLYELHISSELHRAQLMNIILGKQSVALILSGRGMQNYVRLSMH